MQGFCGAMPFLADLERRLTEEGRFAEFKEKFEEVLDRALREAEKHRRDEAGFLLVKTRNRTVSVPKSGIFYVESRGKKAEVHTGKDAVEMYASLNGLEAELGAGFTAATGDTWSIWHMCQNTIMTGFF